jgi:hypothetical protein
MRTTQLIKRLEKSFTKEQAEDLAEILEEMQESLVTKSHADKLHADTISRMSQSFSESHTLTKQLVSESKTYTDLVVAQAKFDLVKWIVGGVIANGIVATLLKYLA